MATEKVKVYEEQAPKKGLPIWAWLLPLLLLLALGIWLFSRSHNTDSGTAAAPAAVVADNTKPDAAPPTQAQDWTAAGITNSIKQNGRIGLGDNEVHFATNSAKLAGDSQNVLDQVALALKNNSDWHMRVVGHTDSTGNPAANSVLAQQRAQSVMAYLVSHGVNKGDLRVEGKGEAQPVASNNSDTGRAENRRVELIKE